MGRGRMSAFVHLQWAHQSFTKANLPRQHDTFTPLYLDARMPIIMYNMITRHVTAHKLRYQLLGWC